MTKILATVFSLMICFNSLSQIKTIKNETEVRTLSKKVSDLFFHDSISYAFTELQTYWPIPSGEIDNVRDKMFTYMEKVKSRYGDPIDSRKLKEEKVSDFALRETYILRYSYHALRLIFIFYKGNSGWIVNAFKFDDTFSEEFKE